MPTRSGWSVLVGGLGFIGAGRLFGSVSFLVVGCVAIAAVVLAVATRRFRPSRVAVARHLTPPRVQVGDSARVDLEVVNRGRYRTPLMRLHDTVAGTGGVQLSLAPLAAKGGTVHGAYRFPTERRGVLHLGPIQIEDVDALGLARRRHHVNTTARLIVHPRVETLPPTRLPAGDDSLLGAGVLASLGLSDEEFDGLRDYVPGDDPRKIHWPSSARLDELQVRQFRPPSHGQLSIVIDTRPPSDSAEAQDVTTSVAASIASSVLHAGGATRIATTDGHATPLVSGWAQLGPLLDFLTLLDGGSPNFHPGISRPSGSVIATTADPLLSTDHAMRQRFAARLRASVVITVDVEHWGDGRREAAGTGDWIHLTGPGQLPNRWRFGRNATRAGAK